MPAVLDALANSAGVSRGELQAMASQGEITSDIIFKALSEQAAGFDGLSKRLNEQQKTFNDLGTATEKLLTSIGKLFGPAVITGAKALANAADEIGTFFNYLGSKIFPETQKGVDGINGAAKELTTNTLTFGQALKGVLQVATFVGTFVGVIKSVAIGIEIWTKATLVLAGAKKALGAAMAFVLALTVKGLLVVAAAATAAVLAADEVGKQIDAISADMDDFTAQQKAAEAASAGLVDNFSGLPPEIEDAKEKTKQLKEAQDAVTKAISESSEAIDKTAAMNQTIADQRSSSAAAYFQAEMQINDVLLDQLNRQLDGAKTQKDRINIARDIYKLSVTQAKLEYEIAKVQISAAVEKASLALQATELKAKEVQLAVELAAAEGTVNDSHRKSLALSQEATALAGTQLSTAKLIAAQQLRGAEATLQGKIQTAEAAFQSNILAKNTSSAASAAERLATGFQQAAAAASSISNNETTKKIYGSTTTTTTLPTGTPIPGSKVLPFAKGGVVTKPTLGLIGEAGTEYIVPESKAAAFAANYLSGARGSSAIPGGGGGGGGGGGSPTISIQTGPVMQMNGQNYVTTQDLSSAVQAGVQQTLNMMRNDRGTRRAVGLA
jgi:predicted  nucleic acid-binding Zn-ribbon protein